MTPFEKERKEEENGFLRGYHGMPDDVKLHKMSFVELAVLLSSCEGESAKFKVVERELKKHLAKDQAEINRKNIFLGACLGGIFGLIGVFLGAQLKNSPSSQQLPPIAAIQPSNGGVATTYPAWNVAPIQSSAIPPSSNSDTAQSNAQPLNPTPSNP